MFDKKHPVFTGIVESSSKLIHFAIPHSDSSNNTFRIQNLKMKTEDIGAETICRISIERPQAFNDIKTGDSICVNGVCLTVVGFDDQLMHFELGPETLKITGWNQKSLLGSMVNLERSMKYGDRVHGHFLSGHVDEVAKVVRSQSNGSAWDMTIMLSSQSKNYVWKKGSLGISGVSLTVNDFQNELASVCLIPETIKLTNLTSFKEGDSINIEFDWMAKAFYNQIQNLNIQFGNK